MRIYLGGIQNDGFQRAREAAPSHVIGATRTPTQDRMKHLPYFVDNGAFTDSFDYNEWIGMLDALQTRLYPPDYVVLPDVLGDAEATLDRHRRYIADVLERGFRAAAVIQPGMDVGLQVRLADRIGAHWVFVGGDDDRFKKAHGEEIVGLAHDLGLGVHIASPPAEDGWEWAHRIGADAGDSSSIVSDGSYHKLEALPAATEPGLSSGGLIKQSRLGEVDADA